MLREAGLPALAGPAGRHVTGPPLDPAFARRLQTAGAAITWRAAPRTRRPARTPAARLARLRDEEACVEVRELGEEVTVEVTAGPVGAVVLLLEVDRRGLPDRLGSRNGGAAPAFPDGSIVAGWGVRDLPSDATPTLRDLVELARFALD